ncbi:phosphopantetheine-binding protein, partial [Fulvivirga imtechensis]|uniref:phosphopantetheine-binding protein n=1 Tax=Fulvivirga imtechensis TaxID=881893 RepID=UPI00058EDEF2
GIDDDFFALGGHSLKATSLTTLIFDKLDIKISIKEIFKHPTIRKLTMQISKEQGQNESLE